MVFRPVLTACALSLAGALCANSAAADPALEFYKGKTVRLVNGGAAGSGYDLYARLLTRYLGKQLPGNPAVVPQNMPGAGSIKAAIEGDRTLGGAVQTLRVISASPGEYESAGTLFLAYRYRLTIYG